MRKIQLGHFEEQEQFDGTPWPPLSSVTIANRRKEGEGAQPLRDTNLMFTSITYKAGKGYAVTGTNDPKAPYHQLSDDESPPRREFIFLREENVQVLLDMLTNALIEVPLRMP